MVAKITNKVRRLNSLKLWSAITGVALVVALLLTFLPYQVDINTDGLLSISLGPRQATAQETGMKQVIPGGYYDPLSVSATEYNTLVGYIWSATENERQNCASAAGTISRLLIELTGSPGAGKSYNITLMKNGVATDLSVTIAGTATSGSDTSHNVSVAGGDEVGLMCTPSGTPSARYARWSVLFEGGTAKQSWIPGGVYAATTATRYAPLWHGTLASSSVGNDNRQVIPTAGKIRNLYISGSTSPGGGTKTYRFTLRKNGVSTALTCDMVGDATIASDTVHEVTIAAGDYVTLMVERIDAPSADIYCAVGTTFVADTNGESVILGGSSGDLSASVIAYNYASHSIYSSTWNGAENNRYQGAQPTTFKKLYVLLSNSPGADKSYDIGLRHNGTTKISVTIAGSATTGNNTTDTFDPADLDEINVISVPSGTPTVSDAYWGFVSYIAPEGLVAPTVTTQAATDVLSASCTGNGNITDTGGENCTTRGFCYMVGQAGDPTTANSTAHDEGSYEAGTYNKSITGLTPSTYYRVRAYAINSAGTGYGTTVQVTTLPGDPDNLTDTAHNGTSVDLEWTKGTGADYTLIRYKTTGYPTDTSDGTSGYNSTSNTTSIESLNYGQIYYFRAWAWNSTTTLFSNGTSDRTCYTDPNAPTSFVVTETTCNSTALSWTKGTGADKTRVQYRDDQYPTTYSDGTQAYFDTGTSVNVTGLDSGQIYYFRAWSYDTESGYYDSYAQLTDYTLPGDPSALNASSPTVSTIDVSWTKGTGGDKTMVRYKIGSYPTSTSDGTQLYFDTGTSQQATSLNATTTYYFRCWSYDSDSTYYSSGYSSDTETTLTPAPEIANTPDSWDFGILEVGTTAQTTISYFTLNNTGNCAVDVTIQGTDVTNTSIIDCYDGSADTIRGEDGNAWSAQTFTTPYSYTATSAVVAIFRVGSPGNIVTSIRATDGTHPIGDDLCLGTTNGDTLPYYPDYEWREINWDIPVTLNSSTKYALVVRVPTGNQTNCGNWKIDNTSPTYTNGNLEFSLNGGTSWSSATSQDFLFKIYGTITWDLADDATPGENIYGLYAGKDDADDLFDVIVRETVTYNTLVDDLGEGTTQGWGLKIYMPTSLSGYDAQQMSGTVTLVASAA